MKLWDYSHEMKWFLEPHTTIWKFPWNLNPENYREWRHRKFNTIEISPMKLMTSVMNHFPLDISILDQDFQWMDIQGTTYFEITNSDLFDFTTNNVFCPTVQENFRWMLIFRLTTQVFRTTFSSRDPARPIGILFCQDVARSTKSPSVSAILTFDRNLGGLVDVWIFLLL